MTVCHFRQATNVRDHCDSAVKNNDDDYDNDDDDDDNDDDLLQSLAYASARTYVPLCSSRLD